MQIFITEYSAHYTKHFGVLSYSTLKTSLGGKQSLVYFADEELEVYTQWHSD